MSMTLLLVLGCVAGWAQNAPQVKGSKFNVTFPRRITVKSAGEYRVENLTMNLETFSALCLEPSTTATFEVQGPETRSITRNSGRNHLVIDDSKPALKENPNKEPIFTRAEGAISAFTWVEGTFTNPIVTGEINSDGGPGGKGSSSRQGLMARWDQGNNFYWFFIDYAQGTYAIMRSRFFGVMEQLADNKGTSSWPVPNFQDTNSYMLEFDLQGDTAKGRIYTATANGERGSLIAETPLRRDKDPFLSGLSGYLAEASIGAPYKALHGSFDSLTCQEK
jgi:hypothetical protein